MKRALLILLIGLGPLLAWAEGKSPSLPNVLIGSAGSGDGEFEFKISAMAPAPDGCLYVCDEGNSRVQVFSPEGKFLRRWGQKGDQPGDFQIPENITVTKEGIVLVEDSGRQRIFKFDLTGKPLGDWALPQGTKIIGFDPLGDSYGFVFGQKFDEFTVYGPEGSPQTVVGHKLINWPERIAGDGKGNYFIDDHGAVPAKPALRMFRLEGGNKVVWQVPAQSSDKDHGTNLAFAIHLGPDGDLYTLASRSEMKDGKFHYASFLREYSPNGTLIHEWELADLSDIFGGGYDDFALLGKGRVALHGPSVQIAILSLDHPMDKPTLLPPPEPAKAAEAVRHLDFAMEVGAHTGPGPNEPEPSRTHKAKKPKTKYMKVRGGGYVSRSYDFSQPKGLSLDGEGNLYVVSTVQRKVFRYGKNGKLLGAFAPPEGKFEYCAAVAVSGKRVYALDEGAKKVVVFNLAGEYLKSWDARFGSPAKGIAADAKGNLYVTGGPFVRKYNPNGEMLLELGGSGQGSSQFYGADGIAVSKKGFIYVTDPERNAVKVFSTQGKFIKAWENAGQGVDQLNHPNAVAVDDQGRVYLTVDQGEGPAVQVFDPHGKFLGSFGIRSHDLSREPGMFQKAEGIAVDAKGRVFVADEGGDRVQVFGPRK